MRQAVILSAVRTPIGRFLGGLSTVPAPKLGALVVREAVRRAGVTPEQVDEVIMGNILSAGLGQAPARQAAMYASLPPSVPATTVNKMCGSGLKAVMLAAQAVRVGDAEVVVAGGMENMSQAPYLLPRARTGYRLGHGELLDSMIHDGLWDAYRNCHMGSCAELLAAEYRITREEQDRYAVRSYRLALEALDRGLFRSQTVPVELPDGKGVVEEDEEPRRVNFEKIPHLPPAFEPNGTVTAANASSISDGAAAVVVAAEEVAERLGRAPMARIVGYTTAATEPEWFTIAPAYAIE
ncbi:MAG: acetyl-CoA C-acyltransferase, partial [Armatimonadota bacterium]|nr:acetyl-CoA C-acyltransferase [Armatimonadota bacterium]